MKQKKKQWIQQMVERYERPLCQYAYRITGHIESAQDAVQDTFVKLCNKDILPDELTAPWLYRVCRNRCIDIIRKDKPMEMLSEARTATLPASGKQPDESLQLRDSLSQLMQQLAKLPANQAEVIRLKFQHHMSYRQIAEVTKLTESNVGYLIHVGIKTLRQQTKELQEA